MFDVRTHNFELWIDQLNTALKIENQPIKTVVDLGCADMKFSKMLYQTLLPQKMLGYDILSTDNMKHHESYLEYQKLDLQQPFAERLPQEIDLCCFINMFYVLQTNEYVHSFLKEKKPKYFFAVIPSESALEIYEKKNPGLNHKSIPHDEFIQSVNYTIIFDRPISHFYYLINPILLYFYPLTKVAMKFKKKSSYYYHAVLAKAQ